MLAPLVLRPLTDAASLSCCQAVRPITRAGELASGVAGSSSVIGTILVIAGTCLVMIAWGMLSSERSPKMANTPEFDWSGLTGQTVARIKEQKVVPVPDAIVRAAQRSLDGVPHPTVAGRVDHILEHEFKSDAEAEAAAKLLKKAGAHTSPPSSVRVVVDPYAEARDPADQSKPHPLAGNRKIIRWKAGGRTGVRNS